MYMVFTMNNKFVRFKIISNGIKNEALLAPLSACVTIVRLVTIPHMKLPRLITTFNYTYH